MHTIAIIKIRIPPPEPEPVELARLLFGFLRFDPEFVG
jgi:hypothetical protein